MNKKNALKLEFIGLIFVLISFFFQTFIYQSITSLSDSGEQYRMEKKVDMIFDIVRDNYSKLNPKILPSFSWNPEVYRNYQYAGEKKDFERINSQKLVTKIIMALLFIFGSILIIIGKIIEYKIIK